MRFKILFWIVALLSLILIPSISASIVPLSVGTYDVIMCEPLNESLAYGQIDYNDPAISRSNDNIQSIFSNSPSDARIYAWTQHALNSSMFPSKNHASLRTTVLTCNVTMKPIGTPDAGFVNVSLVKPINGINGTASYGVSSFNVENPCGGVVIGAFPSFPNFEQSPFCNVTPENRTWISSTNVGFNNTWNVTNACQIAVDEEFENITFAYIASLDITGVGTRITFATKDNNAQPACFGMSYKITSVADTTKPKGNMSVNNTSPKINDKINFTINATDETSLSWFLFLDNQTGKMRNQSIILSGTATDYLANFSSNITVPRGTIINFTGWWNDTNNNINQNSTLITINNTPPSFDLVLGGAKEKEPYNSSLVGYWDFDNWNETYVFDRTSNNNGGLIAGANRSYGKLGWGMVFDGVNDYVSALDSSLFSFPNKGFTVEVWIKPSVSPDNYDSIVGKWNNQAPATKEWLFRFGTSGTFEFRLIDSTNTGIGRSTTDTIPVGQWTHIVGTYDGSTTSSGVQIYINGVRKDTTAIGTSYAGMNDTSAKLFMGVMEDTVNGNNGFFNGIIDEVEIWNVALSADDIAKRYSQNKGTGNITTQSSLSVAVNSSSDADNDVLFTAVDWWKCLDNGNLCQLNATTGKPNDNGVALWLPLDERNTVSDYSFSNNNVIIQGGTKFTNNSAIGLGAYEFDGVNDILNITSSPVSTSVNYTIMAWVKYDTLDEGAIYGSWFNTVDNSVILIGLSDHQGGKANTIKFTTFTNGLSVTNTTSDSGVIPSLGDWTHIAAVYSHDGDTSANRRLRIYTNGIERNIASVTSGGTSQGSGNFFAVGLGHDGTSNNYFDGIVDEFYYFNRNLSASEISQFYWAGVRKGLILNSSQTRKNEIWNATITLYDAKQGVSTSANFSFDKIRNTIPNGTNFFNTTIRHGNRNMTFNITSAAFDPDVGEGIDTLYYLFYQNFSGDWKLLSNTTDLNVTTNISTGDGHYGLLVNVTDLEATAKSSILAFEIDTDTPSLEAFNYTDSTFTNQNLTLLVAVKDNSLPYNNSIRVWKGSRDYHTNSSTARVGKYINLTNLNLNLTEDGNYTIEINFSDAVSESPLIKDDYKKGKKGESELIFNDSKTNSLMLMKIWFVEKQDKLTDTPATLKSYSEFNQKGTHLNFGVNFTVVKPETKIIFNLSIDKENFDVINNSGIEGLIVFYPKGIDFDGVLLVNGISRGYNAIVTKIDNKNVQVKIEPTSVLAGNDVVEFRSESIFGLNVVTFVYNLVIDRTPPSAFSFNISGFPINNTFTNQKNFNITVNGSDDYTAKAQLYINDIINSTSNYNNESVNITNIPLPDGNHTLTVQINDTAGNKINFSYFYKIVIDTIIPTNISPLNRTVIGNSTNILDNTDVNLTVEIRDTWLDSGNFSENCTSTSRSWINHSVNIESNKTYHNVLGSANFSAGQVCGWKYYFYDRAGNELDPIFTFKIGSSATTSPASSSDDTSTATQGTGTGTTQATAEVSSELNPNDPINVFFPSEWLIEKDTEVKIFFFNDQKKLHDPIIINFEFKPYDYFIYKDLKKHSIGNYTAIFYTQSFARLENPNDGSALSYTLKISAISSPEVIKEVTFTIKKSSFVDAITQFAQERKEDTLKVIGKITGSNKEKLTTWQIIVMVVASIFGFLMLLLIIAFFVYISKVTSRGKKHKDLGFG